MDQHIFDHAPKEVYDDLARGLLNFTVVFVAERNDQRKCRGSATLVKFGTVYGLVTCGHVTKDLLTSSKVSISTHDANSNNKLFNSIDIRTENTIILGENFDQLTGPDLSFIRLDGTAVETLKSKLVFIDADSHRDRAKRGQKSFPYHCDYVVGSVEELNVKLENNVEIVQQINAGTVTQPKSTTSQFDYFDFESLDIEPLNQSHQGTSGGSWWRLSFEQNKLGEFKIAEKIFLGVAFMETGDLPNIIRGHGPKSIYETLRTAIEAKFAQ